MILTLKLLAILGLFALSTIPFAMAAEEDEDTVVVDGDPTNSNSAENSEEED